MKADDRGTVVIVCNAMSDALRRHRAINTDSPAASKKVFGMCEALSRQGWRVRCLSLGRGGGAYSRGYYPPMVERQAGYAVLYAGFSAVRGWTYLRSAFSLWWHFLRVAGGARVTVIYYNRFSYYIPLALWARWSSLIGPTRCVVDLEDGTPVTAIESPFLRLVQSLRGDLFDVLAPHGALLACEALRSQTSVTKAMAYYGIVDQGSAGKPYLSGPFHVLMGGTISQETGAATLLSAIAVLRAKGRADDSRIVFHVSGMGPLLGSFAQLVGHDSGVEVVVHGRLSAEAYGEMRSGCHAGLALKQVGGPLASTTFPSKVIEYASHGMLVISTDISDVRSVLGDEGAYFLSSSTPGELASILAHCAANPVAVQRVADSGHRRVMERCNAEAAGLQLSAFLGEMVGA